MNNGVASGLFCFNVNNAPSNANWNIGASNLYKINACTLPHREGKIKPQKARVSKQSEYPRGDKDR